jgi:hypothetical protein
VNADDRRKLTADRFAQWSVLLEAERATPAAVISLSDDQPPQLIVTTIKEVDDTWLIQLLEKVSAIMRLRNRRPLDPIPGPVLLRMTSGELGQLDLARELQDVLASLGTVVALDTIRDWSGEQCFQAFAYARALRARQQAPRNVPAKPAFIP